MLFILQLFIYSLVVCKGDRLICSFELLRPLKMGSQRIKNKQTKTIYIQLPARAMTQAANKWHSCQAVLCPWSCLASLKSHK